MADELPKSVDFSTQDIIVINGSERYLVSDFINKDDYSDPLGRSLPIGKVLDRITLWVDEADKFLILDFAHPAVLIDISEAVAEAYLTAYVDEDFFGTGDQLPDYVARFEDLVEARRQEVCPKPTVWDDADTAYEEERDRRSADDE